MKRTLYFLAILATAATAFLAGSLYDRGPAGVSPAGRQQTAVNQNPAWQSEADLADMPPGTVAISPERQQTVGIRVGQAEKKTFTHTVRLLGRVAADETRTYFINATIDGWVTQTMPNTTGSFVRKDETLAAFYSSEFLSAGQALLFALSSMDRVRATGKEAGFQKEQITQFKINLQQYKDSLRNLGMGVLQIEEMIRTRKYMENVNVTSPTDGIILVRNVSLGQRFEKGTELYRIADISRVWLLADIYETEPEAFRPGTEARVTLPYQKKAYAAKVSDVLPVFDPATRTLKVRLETENPGFVLRPDMFVDVELPVTYAPAVMVSSDAVIYSGMRKTVFIDRGNGMFEPREVKTGRRMAGQVEIVEGLNEGEKIVISGNFLVDSESKLSLAASGMQPMLEQDPVCGQEVSPRQAEKQGRRVAYGGKSYLFCSDAHRQQFERDPEQYLKK
ncbi:MAG: efflux RND transporter periplasmic adaptor subunit [Deltaproteobacteria bacterium]|nr:efflux RND transporter periplasmic adaptor subunit [Deltaproteobacteria bacterium]